MKILLTAINAKYIHSNLAVYSLKAYAQTVMQPVPQIEIAEYTINQQEDMILQDIYQRKPDVLCMSCYIWNQVYVRHIVREVKKICPAIHIWMGGPEVSYDAADVLAHMPEIMGIMKGEGEQTFAELCKRYAAYEGGTGSQDFWSELTGLAGITYQDDKGVIWENPWRPIMDLNEVPFIYDRLEDFQNKILYYESSRGCPFSCSYCLSSVDKKLRFRSINTVKQELQHFLDHKVRQVKFVDRTFNCNHSHAMAIWSYIAEHDNGITNFHFEIAADIMEEAEIALIKTMRPGLIQLEIGVQSTNPDTIREIQRTMQFEKVSSVVKAIRSSGNIHQHLDLIVGLPFEGLERFSQSFDHVYGLYPEQLQLGFLKVLKGSRMSEKAREYGLVYKDQPPYEVLLTKWLTYEDVLILKGIEEMVEIYYNSRQFTNTIKVLETEFTSAFSMFEQLSTYCRQNTAAAVQHKRSARYELLLDFIARLFPERTEVYRELLTYDYYLRENAKSRPEFAGAYLVAKEWLKDFYNQEAGAREYLAGYEAYDKGQMRKMTHIERFEKTGTTIIFDYLHQNPLNHEARTYMIKENN